jgi:hypothetical protein
VLLDYCPHALEGVIRHGQYMTDWISLPQTFLIRRPRLSSIRFLVAFLEKHLPIGVQRTGLLRAFQPSAVFPTLQAEAPTDEQRQLTLARCVKGLDRVGPFGVLGRLVLASRPFCDST